MAGSLLAQTLSVTITGTLGNVIGGSGYITKPGKYVSGITATGSKGQYCMISYSGGSSFCVKLLAGLCLCLGMAGSLLAQTLSVTITGTLGNVIGGSGYITATAY